jgi:hypothetical protein
MSKIW